MKYIEYALLLTLVFAISGCSKSDESNEEGSQPERTTSSPVTTVSEPNYDFADDLLDDAYKVKYFGYYYEPWEENPTSEESFSKDEIIEGDFSYSAVLYDKRMHPTAQFIYYYSHPGRPAEVFSILIFTTDDRGLILSINYFDENGEWRASSTTIDFHRIVYTYDVSGNRTSESGYGINGEPVRIYNMAHRIEREYNGNGKRISENYYGINGKPLNAEFESCRIEWEYDENGNCTSVSGYGTNGERAGYNYDCHRTEWEYDENDNWVSRSYYDDDGKPMVSMLPNCKFDTGDDGEFALGHKTLREFDENGRVVSERYFDINNQPSPCCYGGVHEVRLTYDAAGNLLSDSYYGLNREPISVENYYDAGHRRKYKYRVIEGETVLIERAFFGVDGEPFANCVGFHRYVNKYPEGLDGKTVRIKYDVNGNVIE